MILDRITCPADLRGLGPQELETLAGEIRAFVVESVSRTGGHLGSNLGAVELTLAVHRVFDSPRDILLWDTGHQAYVHKLVTGRQAGFAKLRQAGGLSGYPSRAESEHDWVENSHASTILSYSHGLATAMELAGDRHQRKIVAVVGDGALTGGMAYEALNNLGHSGRRVVIVLNDNGRSYAPTVSRLSESLTRLRLNPSYMHARTRVKQILRELPAGVGGLAYSSLAALTAAVREAVEPHVFFEALGVRYTGPIDGHDIATMEQALHNAAEWDGPIVVHVLTHKGKGYAPAEDDDVQCLHDLKVRAASAPAALASSNGPGQGGEAPLMYTDVFTQTLLELAERHPQVVALTAAMPGPTGLLAFHARYPDRCFDVGIAEQHAVTAAAGMAMGGLRPVVAVYSTFFSRAFDQANLDVGLHGLPVVFALDRAGITGDDGPSHHGVVDLALCLSIPGMTVFAPSSAQELAVMLASALDLEGPVSLRWPKTPARQVPPGQVGSGLAGRRAREGDGSVCILAVGKMVEAAEEAASELAGEGVDATVWDVRVVKPPDPAMLADAARHRLVVTVEDGLRVGGAGAFLADCLSQLDLGQLDLGQLDLGQLGLGHLDLGHLDRQRSAPRVMVLGTPMAYIPQGKPADILAHLGLDGPGVARSVRRALLPVAGLD